MGQVNLMAVEEFAEVKDRYERQKANYDDTQKSLDNLIRVSEEIKSKSSEMFLETYNKIKKNFRIRQGFPELFSLLLKFFKWLLLITLIFLNIFLFFNKKFTNVKYI